MRSILESQIFVKNLKPMVCRIKNTKVIGVLGDKYWYYLE